jgi:hopanoid biosynthesis associated radical SAM protein HpnH
LSIPAVQKIRIGAYILRRMLLGKRRFPLVLMLEPLYRCNLHCRGCGKIARPPEILNRQLRVAECVSAARDCGAPVVSIAGGEPLLHRGAPEIIGKLTARKRFVYLCTNALLVENRINEFTPSPYFTFNIHLDGLRRRHDQLVCRPGVFDIAVKAIRLLLSRGFRVTTNTTFYGDETPENASQLFDFLMALGVEGMTIAPAFAYENAAEQHPFAGRKGAQLFFRRVFELGRDRNWKFNHSRRYLDFLAGHRDYECTPWGNPTYTILGWQRPCYLLDDGYADTYGELMEKTDWQKYLNCGDPRCMDCLVHCGYEASAVIDTVKNPWKIARHGHLVENPQKRHGNPAGLRDA